MLWGSSCRWCGGRRLEGGRLSGRFGGPRDCGLGVRPLRVVDVPEFRRLGGRSPVLRFCMQAISLGGYDYG